MELENGDRFEHLRIDAVNVKGIGNNGGGSSAELTIRCTQLRRNE